MTLNQDGSHKPGDTLTDASGAYSYTLTSGSGIDPECQPRPWGGQGQSLGGCVGHRGDAQAHPGDRVRFENARKMVAADTNRDASVDVADIVAMRKVILARTDYFSDR